MFLLVTLMTAVALFLPGNINEAEAASDAPFTLKVSNVTTSLVDLSWNTEHQFSELYEFVIYRKTANSAYSDIALVNNTVTGYTDTTVQSLQTYTYKVVVFHKFGDKLAATPFFSNEVGVMVPHKVTTPPPPPEAPSNLAATVTKDPHVKLYWTDNSSTETGFKIFRKEQFGSYQEIDSVGADATSYTDTNITAGSAYYYKIRAFNVGGHSAFTKELLVQTMALAIPDTSPTIPGGISPPTGAPAAPTGLKVNAVFADGVELQWTDQSNNETFFEIERKTAGSSFAKINSVPQDWPQYTDLGLTTGTAYSYRVRACNAAGCSTYSNTVEAILQGSAGPGGQPPGNTAPGNAPSNPPANPVPGNAPSVGAGNVAIQLRIGNTDYSVNGNVQMMDAPPVVRDGRTLLPIRYVAQPLGAAVGWDAVEQKTSVTLGGKVIELWIGENRAMVNGREEFIDPDNPDVVPIILPPGRTMLPLRFIAEKLGCEVGWDGQTSTVTVTSGGTTTPAPEL